MEISLSNRKIARSMRKALRLLGIVIVLCCGCQSPDRSDAGWQMVFRNDANEQTTHGHKSKLIDAVRLGYPIRVGWGGNRVEHVADADFLTIFEGKEVFAQIRTIIGQAPRIDGDSLKIRFRAHNHWTMMAGTNGYSTALMTDYFQDTIVVGGEDRYSATTWYVLYPHRQTDKEARPLWRTGSPNWEVWEEREK